MKISPVTPNFLSGEFLDRLSDSYPPEEIRQFLRLLFEEYLGWSKMQLHLSGGTEIPAGPLPMFYAALSRLQAGEPLQYILGKAWFDGMALKVGPGVLIPRPETEEMCSIIGNDHREIKDEVMTVLDIGTGSGCIAIDLKRRFPNARVTAVEVSEIALFMAEENAREQQCDINFVLADVLNMDEDLVTGAYHIIVSNPPYVTGNDRLKMRRNVTEHEPPMALFVPDESPLLFYHAIARFAVTHLGPGGHLYFEINEKYGNEIKTLQENLSLNGVEILKDLNGKERFTRAASGVPSVRHS